MRTIKYILIGLSLLLGVSFLYAGIGFNIPEVAYSNVASYGVPVGAALLVLAMTISQWWSDDTSSGVNG
jgi:uncharacterized membrane protein YphA (DoxX/SURF4 family)